MTEKMDKRPYLFRLSLRGAAAPKQSPCTDWGDCFSPFGLRNDGKMDKRPYL